ncbi:hypothetical protein C518_2416, partial [Lysinibacillus fusiformis ZB2]
PNPNPNPKGEGGTGNGSDTNGHNTQRNGRKRIRITKQKVFCTNPEEGIYQVRMVSGNSGTAYLKVSVSGEEDNEPTEVESAIKLDNNQDVSVNGNTVGPFTVVEGKNSLQFKLKQAMRVRLEVSINGG